MLRHALCILIVVLAVPVIAQQQVAPTPAPVTAADLRRWMTELSNWGRWGANDQLGALNLITPEVRRRAAALVRAGVSVTLSRQATTVVPVAAGAPSPNAWQRDFLVNANGAAVERLTAPVHGTWQTHLDGLCHFFYEGKSFNGYPQEQVASAATGCTKLDIDALKDGIITRGVLVDIPRLKGVPYLEGGYAVTREDLEAWERMSGITVSAGDVVLVHTGRALRPGNRGAGFHPNVIPWVKARDVAVLGSDGGQEVMAPEGFPFYIHLPAIVALGVPIICGADLQAAAEMAAKLNRWEFLFTAATLRIPGISSSPFNPVAVF